MDTVRQDMIDGVPRSATDAKDSQDNKGNADKQVEQAETLFTTGLEDGFNGTYEIQRAIAWAEQMGEDASTRSTMDENHTMVVTLSSKGVRADGLAEVTVVFRKVASRVETADGPISVDFDLTADLPENADELTGLDTMLPALKEARVLMLVDAMGNVTSVEGLPEVSNIVPELGIIPPALLGTLEETQFAVLMSKIFNAEGGVERSNTDVMAKDHTWTTVEEIDLGESGELVVTRSWSPREAKGDGHEASGSFSVAVQLPPTPNDAAPKCDIAGFRGTGRLLWRPEGGLEYLNSTEVLAMQWTLGEQALRTTQESTTTVQRVED